MTSFEYKVVPAPRKTRAPRKVKGPEAKFATTLTDVMNEMAAEGWEYQRAETLPCEERQGFTGKTTKYHSMLVFRRPVAADAVADVDPAPIRQAPAVAAPAAISEAASEPKLTRTSDGPAPEGFMQDAADSLEQDSEREETDDAPKRDETA